MKTVLIIFISLLTAGGCATRLPQSIDLPSKKSDFRLCKKSLLEKYPDIEKYESRFRWDFEPPQGMNNIYQSLGPPDKSNLSWWNTGGFVLGGIWGGSVAGISGALAGAVLLGPYYMFSGTIVDKRWKVGNYDIEATVFYSAGTGFKEKFSYFKWSEITANECTTPKSQS